MPQTIQLKRGLKANLPASAAAGEALVTTDTHEMSIGTGAGLSPLAIDYANVTNKPAIPAAPVNSDWNAGSGLAQILNKPTLGTAAAQNSSAFVAATSAVYPASGTILTNAAVIDGGTF
jgi:hypothetical protein